MSVRRGKESVDGNLESAVFLHRDVWGSKTLGGQGSLRLVAALMMMLIVIIIMIMVIFFRYFLISYLALYVEVSQVAYYYC